MRVLDLFAGIGGFSLAAHWMGWETAAFVEWDKYCQKVLAKNFPNVPIYDDIRDFDGTKYRGQIDIITGGFPCQPFSQAGKQKGKDDQRYLFPEMLRVIEEVRPGYVVAENVRGLLSIENGEVFTEICSQLESKGYNVWTFGIPASAVEAPHERMRVWIIAKNSDSGRARNIDGAVGNEGRTTGTNRGESLRQIHRSQSDDRIKSASGNAPDTHTKNERIVRREREQTDHAGECRCGNDQCRRCGGFNGSEDAPNGTSERLQESGFSGIGGLRTQERERLDDRFEQPDRDASDSDKAGLQRNATEREISERKAATGHTGQSSGNPWRGIEWIEAAARFCRVDDGIPAELDFPRDNRVNRLKALGNSIVPQIAYEIFRSIEAAQ